MYKCLCGRFPFVQPSANYDDKRLALKLMVAYTSPAEANPLELSGLFRQRRVADELTMIVTKSLRKLPKERYDSANEMKQHIERIDRSCVRCLLSSTIVT